MRFLAELPSISKLKQNYSLKDFANVPSATNKKCQKKKMGYSEKERKETNGYLTDNVATLQVECI